MTVIFPIPDLERIVEPDNLIETLDVLLNEGKITSYYYDWERGEVQLEISERAAVEELFKDFTKGKLSS